MRLEALRFGDADPVPIDGERPHVGPVEILVETTDDGPGQRTAVTVRNTSRQEVALDRIGLVVRCPTAPARALEHGWQGWSVVRRCPPVDVRPARQEFPRWARSMLFADPRLAGTAVVGDQFLVTDVGVVGFLDGRGHLGAVEAIGDDTLVAWALLDGVTLSPGGERALSPLWTAAGDPGRLYSELMARWGRATESRTSTAAPMAWCSWYEYFGEVGVDDVRANLSIAAEHGLEVVQIDDGYQAEIGAWLSTSAGWPPAMGDVAGEIARAGLRAGIWTAPFLAAEDGELARAHPDWVLGRAMYNDAWGGWAVGLDTTNPAVLDHLAGVFGRLAGDGFTYHKIDFCYAAAMPAPPSRGRFDPDATRAEALRRGLDAIRGAIGERSFLLGCGCPFGPAAGVVDAMRVGPDVAPFWAPRQLVPGVEEAAICAENAVRTSVLRAPMHRRLWINDNDCLLLRPTSTELSTAQRQAMVDAAAACGGFTVVSDDLTRYGAAEWETLSWLRSVREVADGPVDIVDPFADPLVVQSPLGSLTMSDEVIALRSARS